MAIIDELLMGLGFDFDPKELDEFQKGVDKSKEILGKFIKVTFAATAAVGALIKTSATATDEVTKQARQINVLVGEYDALLHASEITTGNSNNMASALQNLSVRASEAARGMGSGVEAFGMLGVSVTDANGKLKTTDVLLSETADALNNLGDQGQRLELADKLGLREIDLLLREGSDGIRKYTDEAKELGVITAEDAKAAEDFNDSQSRLFRVLNTLRRMISTGLLPQVQEVVDQFTDWLKVNKDIIKQRFQTFIKILAKVLSALGKIFSIILDITNRFISALGGLDNALKLIVISFGTIMAFKIGAMFLSLIKLMKTAGTAALIMNAKMLLIPILIGAAIAGLALLIDDVITFAKGGDSLIGRFLETFPEVTEAFETFRGVLSDIWDFIEMIGKGIGEFAAETVIKIKSAGDFLGGLIPDNLKSLFSDKEGSDTGSFLDNINPFSSDVPTSAGATTTNSKTIVQTNSFSITSNNPEEVGDAVRKVIEDMAGTGIRNTATVVDF